MSQQRQFNNWISPEGNLFVSTKDLRFNLVYTKGVANPESGTHFFFISFEGIHKGSPITARGLSGKTGKSYLPDLARIVQNPNLEGRYVEIGAGVGEFIPALVENNNLRYRPVIIDPADYQLMSVLLDYGSRFVVDKDHRDQLKQLQERCSIILDPTRVELINTGVEEAIGQCPGLHNYADVLVNNFGPYRWTLAGNRNRPEGEIRRIENIELSLLKDGGKLYLEDRVLIKSEGRLIV